MRYPKFITSLILLLAATLQASDVVRLTLKDEKRHREVPVKIDLPADLSKDKPAPVVLFSHGLGGSSEHYTYFGDYVSEHGYICVHLQHHGSDDLVWKTGGIAKLTQAANATNYVERANDVHFVIDELERLNKDSTSELFGKLDLDKIAMAGHSFGAYTTYAVAGIVAKVGNRELTQVDDRIKCAIAMSPAPPENAKSGKDAFSKIKIPILNLTGTNDTSPIKPVDPKDRQIPYQMTAAKDQYLIVFTDGTHMLFGGRDAKNQLLPLVKQSSVLFLDSYLKQDAKAKEYFKNQFKNDLKENGTIEWK